MIHIDPAGAQTVLTYLIVMLVICGTLIIADILTKKDKPSKKRKRHHKH